MFACSEIVAWRAHAFETVDGNSWRDGAHHPCRHPRASRACGMRMTASHSVNETGRAGLSAAPQNAATGPERSGFAARSAQRQPCAQPQSAPRIKNLSPEQFQAIVALKGRATWGIPAKTTTQ